MSAQTRNACNNTKVWFFATMEKRIRGVENSTSTHEIKTAPQLVVLSSALFVVPLARKEFQRVLSWADLCQTAWI